MADPTFPLPASARQTSVFTGDGVTTAFGPFSSSFKIFSIDDVQVWRKDAGQSRYTLRTSPAVVISMNGADYATFNATFAVAPPLTSKWYVKGARVQTRAMAVKKATQIDTDAVDKQLTQIGVTQQEQLRELDSVVKAERGIVVPAFVEDLVEDRLLQAGPAGTLINGPTFGELGDLKTGAELARDAAIVAKNEAIAAKNEAEIKAEEAAADAVAAAAPVLDGYKNAAAASSASAASAAGAAASSKSAAAISAAAAEQARIDAAAAADATGPVKYYLTKSDANAALAGLPNGQMVEVLSDETRSGDRARYLKTAGVYVFALLMPNTTVDLLRRPIATLGVDTVFGTRDGAIVQVRAPDMALDVRRFDAVGDGDADDTAAWGRWHAFHEAIGSRLRPIGPGTFKLAAGTTYPITSDCTIFGAGMGATEIIHADATAQNLFSFPTPLDRITLCDFSVRGSHDVNRSWLAAYPCYVYNTKDVTIRNVEVMYSRVIGITVRGADRVTVTGCHVHHCARDGINVADCAEAIIIGNRIHDCDDDAIGVHNQVYSYQRGHVIANNKIRKAQGIKALGVQGITITGNTLEFFFAQGISVQSVALNGVTIEGVKAAFGVLITGNTLLDGFNRSALDGLNTSDYYITLSSQSARAGSLTAIPGMNKQPGFDLPYAYFQNVKTLVENVTTTPIPLSQQMLVQGNILGKTLKETGHFSDYGFGLFWLRDGELDIDLSDTAKTRITGVFIAGSSPMKAVVIKDNIAFGIGHFIKFSATGINGSDILVQGNTLTDLLSALLNTAASTTTQRVVCKDNVIDLDPYHRSVGRNADGSWTANNHKTAFTVLGMKGLELYGNRFRNLSRILDTDIGTAHQNGTLIFDGNIIECDPDTLNSFSTVNKGVGVIPQMGNTQIIYMDCNPYSATYGIIYNTMLKDRGSMPTSGKYMRGWFVRNYVPSISGGKVLLGWARLTTGDTHVDGTDWTAVYGTTT